MMDIKFYTFQNLGEVQHRSIFRGEGLKPSFIVQRDTVFLLLLSNEKLNFEMSSARKLP